MLYCIQHILHLSLSAFNEALVEFLNNEYDEDTVRIKRVPLTIGSLIYRHEERVLCPEGRLVRLDLKKFLTTFVGGHFYPMTVEEKFQECKDCYRMLGILS